MNTGKPDSIKSLGHSFQLKKKKCMLRVTCILTVLGFICVYMDCAKLHMYVHAQNCVWISHCFTLSVQHANSPLVMLNESFVHLFFHFLSDVY